MFNFRKPPPVDSELVMWSIRVKSCGIASSEVPVAARKIIW